MINPGNGLTGRWTHRAFRRPPPSFRHAPPIRNQRRNRRFEFRFLLLTCLALLLLPARVSAAGTIALVLGDSGSAYQQFANAFVMALKSSSAQVTLVEPEQAARELPAGTQLVVAAGSLAAEALESASFNAPLLLAMTPRATYDRVKARRAVAGGVLIDQPALRYIRLVKTALPDYLRIGLLAGRDSKESTQGLMQAARELGIRTSIETVEDDKDIYPAMQRMLRDDLVIVATPDTTIFNARTIPSILLGAFRHQVPVIGFSPAYLNAGATVTLYSSPEQIAAQTAEIVKSVLTGNNTPGMQYPQRFTVGINERVARALGLRLEEASAIRERLEKLEHQP